MRDNGTTARRVWGIARVALLVVGLVVMTVSFVGLVDEQLALADVEPWSYLGVLGIVAVLVALGSPWNTGRPRD